jgi:hypothetical protein
VNLALLASFGPVTGFFTLSTSSYAFMKVLNVIFFTISGVVGLIFLRRALDSVFVGEYSRTGDLPALKDSPRPDADLSNGVDQSGDEDEFSVKDSTPPPVPGSSRQILPRPMPADRTPRMVFAAWFVMYAVVGAQMGWVLRPFIGSPDLPFELFRERQSSFFAAFFSALGDLF